jgi:GrpB-like predicted nucleotidyltransferase (UPF0157 family)
LRAALGYRLREIEHIRSTAVPGSAAKPIIDLQACIENPSSVPSLMRILAAAGYEDLREVGVRGHRSFRPANLLSRRTSHIVWNRDLEESVGPVVSGT